MDCRGRLSHSFLDSAWEVEGTFEVRSEEDAREYLAYPEDMCFICPIYEKNSRFRDYIYFLEELLLLQEGGAHFGFDDLPREVWLSLGLLRRERKAAERGLRRGLHGMSSGFEDVED